MSLARVFGRTSKSSLTQFRNYFLSSPTPAHHQNYAFSLLCNRFHSLSDFSSKAIVVRFDKEIDKLSFMFSMDLRNMQAFPLHNGLCSTAAFPHCGMSTFASPEQEQRTPTEKKGDNSGADVVGGEASAQTEETGSTSDSQPKSQSVKRWRQQTKRTAFSDSDSERDMDDLSREDLMKLLVEKEETLENKQNEFSEWKDKFLRSYAEMENVMERTRRDAESSKKFAIQSFAKNLLDVADNLGRASSVTKESFSKIDASEDTVGAMPLLKTLLDGVEMTEKQLAEVFRKAGIEKYDPTDEQFDPNRHNAVFQVSDASKPPGTVAVVLKVGYSLHDRIIRPAEVGVTAVAENEADS